MTPEQQKQYNQLIAAGAPAAIALQAVQQIPTTPTPQNSSTMSKQQVQALQDSLVQMGLMTQAEVNTGYGTYGPKTTAAVAKLNSTKAQMEADITKGANISKVLNAPDATTGAQTPKYNTYADALAAAGGDVTNMTDQYGQPFSAADQAAALEQATAAGQPYFDAMKSKDQLDTEAALAAKQQEFQTYQDTAATNFETEKATQDQTAANQGVLFSGGRAQKLQNLQNTYEKAQASKLGTLGADIGNPARDFQYKYGNESANNLSKYYLASGNTYNPNVATGGVGKSALSSVYNPTGNFQGTAVNTAKAEAQKRAAGLLWNKGNKLLSTGYNNKY